jgi:hypothetical protein
VRSCSSRELSKTTRWTSTSPRTSSATTTRGASQRAAERPCHSATPLPLRRALRRLGAFLAALGGACGIRRRCFSPAFSTFSLWSRRPPLSSLISSPEHPPPPRPGLTARTPTSAAELHWPSAGRGSEDHGALRHGHLRRFSGLLSAFKRRLLGGRSVWSPSTPTERIESLRSTLLRFRVTLESKDVGKVRFERTPQVDTSRCLR